MTDIYPEASSGHEWRVVWFPPDAERRIFHGAEATVRAKAEQVKEWNPLVEHRPYTLGLWEGDSDG